MRLTDRSYLLGSAFPKPCFCCEPFALVRSIFRAAFSPCRPKDWRLILAKNIKNAVITDREINPNNRTHIIKFRVTEKEKLTLELCCKRLNISMSTLIRQSLLGKPVQHTVLVTGGGEDALNILSDLLGQCGKIGGNLNQLARHFNTGGRDTEQLRAQLLTELSALTLFRLDAEKAIGELYGNHQAYKLEEL